MTAAAEQQTPQARPKRHHWWPRLQSGHWTGSDGLVHVTKSNGAFFKTSPLNVGVESELYTRYEVTGQKDLTIERWFSEQIETPFVAAFGALIAVDNVKSSPLPERRPDKERELRELGFVVPKQVETLTLSQPHRAAIDAYIAALLVRNPRYLAKLVAFHDTHGTPLPAEITGSNAIKTIALDNMMSVFELYRTKISAAHFGLLFAESNHEFLFSDAGIVAQEPWQPGPIPFDIHAPLTPKIALEVFPVDDPSPRRCFIMRVNNRGVARMNRIALSSAEEFVFSKGPPPVNFIRKHFGKAAPKSIRLQAINGKVETFFDKGRDRN